MFDLASDPLQLQLPGVPVPRRGLQELADAQRAFLVAFENYQHLLNEQDCDIKVVPRG